MGLVLSPFRLREVKMAHFAQIDENNIVTRVTVVSNDVMLDEQGVEQEGIGASFCSSLFGGSWVQTSYNETFRKNFAGVGFFYDASKDAFIAPRPFASWSLNETTCKWEPPTPYPADGKNYLWDEETTSWVEVI